MPSVHRRAQPKPGTHRVLQNVELHAWTVSTKERREGAREYDVQPRRFVAQGHVGFLLGAGGWGLGLRGWGRRGRFAAAQHRTGEDPETSRLTLAPRQRTIEQDHKHPRQPARPFAPAQRAQHKPRLRDRSGPPLPVALHQGERPREDAIGVEALRAGPRDVPDACDLSPAMIVARTNDHQVVTLGECDDLLAQIRRKAQRLWRTIHDLESIDARDDERPQLLLVIAPVFGKGREAQPTLMLDGAEYSDHACRAPSETVARQRLDAADRHDVLAIDAPLDAR